MHQSQDREIGIASRSGPEPRYIETSQPVLVTIMKIRATAILMMVLGAIGIIVDVANFFPEKAGYYAIAGAVLLAAGILVLADN